MRDRRVVITGSPGSGKTATGNTIFGRRVFTFSIIPNNVAMSCGSTNEEFGDPRWFLVVDTPSPLTPAHRDQCMTLCAPGPHAFLLTLRAGRFTAEDKAEIQRLELLFGEEMYNYTIVLFTHSDSIEANGKTLQDHIENANPDLKNLLEKCGQRYHTFDSRNHSDRKQVRELIQRVDDVVRVNGGKHYKRVQEPLKKLVTQSVLAGTLLGVVLRIAWVCWIHEDKMGPDLCWWVILGAGCMLLRSFIKRKKKHWPVCLW